MIRCDAAREAFRHPCLARPQSPNRALTGAKARLFLRLALCFELASQTLTRDWREL